MRRHRPQSRRLVTALLVALGALALVVAGGAPTAAEWSEPAPAEAPPTAAAEATALLTRHRRRRMAPLRRHHHRRPVATRGWPPQLVEARAGSVRPHVRPPRRGPPARSAAVR